MPSSSNPFSKAFQIMQVSHTSVSHSTTTSNSLAALLKPTRFAQARGPSRSGESHLAQARVRRGEQRILRGLAQASPFSPRREHSSIKKNARRLGDISRNKRLGEPLIILPRRDQLAWARKPVLTTVFPYSSQDHNPKHVLNRPKTDTAPINPYKPEKTSKTAENKNNRRSQLPLPGKRLARDLNLKQR